MSLIDTRLHAARPDLADLALKGQVEAARFVAGETHGVAAPVAAVRRAPADDAMLLTEALCGELVTVFETNADGWAWAQLVADRYVGWIPPRALGAASPAVTHNVAALRTLVFPRPDIKSPPLSGLALGAKVAVIGEAEDRNARYAAIAPEGFVVTQHIAPLDAAQADWVAVAERFVGTPYLWGGKTSFGIDCSGLVQVALAAGGHAAPRDTDMQEATVGRPLSFEGRLPPLQRGDLVFWKGHVGIMRDAETLLHANAHHMEVASEPLAVTKARLEGKGLPIASIRRLAGG
jgi:cell wall-associated NlpC family hydrolase